MIAERLRKSILEYAVQGKLTKQIQEDGNSKDLLMEVDIAKEKLIKNKKIRREKKLAEINEDEKPFNIPENWEWVRIGNIVTIKGGKRIPVGRKLTKQNTGYKYIRVSDMHERTVLDNNIHYVPVDVHDKIKNYTISSEDVYITCAGTIGRVGIVPNNFDGANLTENADKLVFDKIDKNWLVNTLESPFVQGQIYEFTTKVGQPKLAIKRIKNLVIPLPPLSEQKRIVKKIEEIFIEIEELKIDELKLKEVVKEFPQKMYNSILQAAMQGKLTEQIDTDSDVDKILLQIEEQKNIIIKEKKIRKQKALNEISEEEIPFEIPENWKWVRFGDLVHFQIGKTPPRSNTSLWKDDFPWVSIADMFENKTLSVTKEGVSLKAIDEVFKNRVSKKGTLIMSFKLSIGRVSYLDIDAVHNEAIISIYPYKDSEIFKDYLFKILPTVTTWGDTKSAIKGKTLNSKSLNNLMIPFPPIEEQKRIVDSLVKILPLCDNIEAKI